MKSKDKHQFNFIRKSWHLLGLVIPIALYLDVFSGIGGLVYATRAIIVSCLVVSLFVLAVVEFLRFSWEGFSVFFWKIFGALMKEGEREYMNATVPYFTANLVVILFFPAELAVISLAFLVIGDPTAAFVGSRYGRHRLYNGKSWEGIAAFILSAWMVGFFLVWAFSGSESAYALSAGMVSVVLVGGVVAGVTEFFSGTTWKGFLDDNLLIPIVSCLVMSSLVVLILDLPTEEVFFPWRDLFLQSK